MNDDINVLHHLGIISRNLEAAVEHYERLGFIFTPLTLPMIPLQAGATPEPIGAGNRCAIFRNNYLEILGVVDAGRWASITREQRGPFDLDAPLQRYEGMHVLHLGSDALDAVHSRLQNSGLCPSDIRPFHRIVDTPDGPQTMRARSLSFPPGSNPEALLQVAQHETPELVLQPRYMQHPNGAISITEVIVCVQDPDGVAKRYGIYAGRTPQKRGALRVVDLGQSRIIVVNSAHLQDVLPGQTAPAIPFLAGFAVSSDLDTTKRALKERGIEFQIHGDRVLVSARDGYGASVLFHDVSKESVSELH
jgi:hypothetical protein